MATKTRKLPALPTDGRYAALDAWLDRVNARHLWAADDSGRGQITAYSVGGHCVLVHRYPEGWELYHPSSKSGKISDALDGAAVFCGVDGCRGLIPA